MKLFFDLFTILLFFVIYKMFGMYWAVGSAMVAYTLRSLFLLIKFKKLDKMQIFTLLIILVLGGATLLTHDEQIFKWKPTAIYALFSLVFLGSHFIGKKVIMQHLLDAQIELPLRVWKQLNASWVVFFIVMALANLYVAYTFSTDVWVNFKLFGVLGLTLLFVVMQSIYLSMHIKEKTPGAGSRDHHE